MFFKNLIVYVNISWNYLIFLKIVLLNDGLYFFNYVWFNILLNLGVEMVLLIDMDMFKN